MFFVPLEKSRKKEGFKMILRRLNDWPTWEWKSPFQEMEWMRRQMDRILGAVQGGYAVGPSAGVFPLTNVGEDDDAYYVRAELPGIKSDDLEISITGNKLSISGERKIPSEGENVKYHRREREAGNFSRLITLSGPVDAAKVEAHAGNGVLTIVLPKAESAKPKQITVKAS
jgi:HSP20 family protein